MQYPQKAINPSKIFSLFIVVVILLASYFFSIKGISQETIRRDELTTLGHIGALETDTEGLSITDTIDSLTTYSEQHPPLYFIMANLWGRAFSYHYITVKLLSVFLGMLTLATLFRLATDIGGRLVGYYTLFSASTSILFLFYSHDMRQYTLALFLAVSMWLLYRRLIQKHHTQNLLQFALLAVIATGMVYTHYSTIFMLLPIGLYHVLFVYKTKRWWQISGAFTLAGIMFLPWLPIAIVGLGGHSLKIDEGEKSYMPVQELIETSSRFFGNGNSILFIMLILLFVGSAIFNSRGSRSTLFYVATSAIIIILMNEYFQLVAYIRYIIVFIIPFSLCAGFGLAFLHKWRIASVIPILICAAWVISGTQFRTTDEVYDQTQTLVSQSFIEFTHLSPLIQEIQPSNTILVPVVRHYGLTRPSKQKKLSILEYYMSWIDMPRTEIHSGILTRERFVLEDNWQDVQGYDSIWLTYPLGDLYEIRKFHRQIKETYTLCQTIEYGERSILDIYVINEKVDENCQES
jgi:hypothetical protein